MNETADYQMAADEQVNCLRQVMGGRGWIGKPWRVKSREKLTIQITADRIFEIDVKIQRIRPKNEGQKTEQPGSGPVIFLSYHSVSSVGTTSGVKEH